MSLLFPVSTLNLTSDKNKLRTFTIIKEFTNGVVKTEIESIFGILNANYSGEIDYDKIIITRSTGISFRLPIYPSATVTIDEKNNKSEINISICLSIYWKILFYFTYILLLTFTIIKIFQGQSIQEIMFIVIRICGSFILLISLVYYYHYSETKNFKFIFESRLNK